MENEFNWTTIKKKFKKQMDIYHEPGIVLDNDQCPVLIELTGDIQGEKKKLIWPRVWIYSSTPREVGI